MVAHRIADPRILRLIGLWLRAGVLESGEKQETDRGTPQGVSELCVRSLDGHTYPEIPFERFADDILCHCGSESQAQTLKSALERRFAECGLELHPTKTKIVYCKDDDRRGNYPDEKFDYLGYTFRARPSKNRWGKFFVNLSPGVSNAATKAIREEIRKWQLRCRVDRWIDDLARMFNPIIRGWITYYGRYYKSALYPTLRYLNRRLARWAMAKYKRLKRHRGRAEDWIRRTFLRDPTLFAHWPVLRGATAGR
ncbi:group II intron maturase-specific domain-containing protein [Bradyrhizobium sp. CB3481]|uniref:group II intron maturase-specific domain-containing protein n=1 Tax=Bradyrhizobium sp. CB3481 TaxID=3039158 RepID=UPI0024B1C151|nr:group II intron maturase-specific domain-containing protein [Bradyrhizobium sp. CB3481]WFU20620.1 group II intron maturase-specific domain-containing protein [Bradyrhizobium sp. CB3481]